MQAFVVDAFTRDAFAGNAAAICLSEEKKALSTDRCQKIAAEFNLSETAFPYPLDDGATFATGKRFALRWFTPTAEVPLCGHATLATAHVIFNELANKNSSIVFETLSGELTVSRTDSVSANRLMMDFPQYEVVSFDGVGSNPKKYRLSKSWTDKIPSSVNRLITSIFADDPTVVDAVAYAPKAKKLLIVLSDRVLYQRSDFEKISVSPDQLLQIDPNGEFVRGVILTVRTNEHSTDYIDGKGNVYDFASRYFAPWVGINEDPATGSAHCCLGPFWQQVLGKSTLCAHQSYPKRGAEFQLRLIENTGRIELTGQSVTIFSGRFLH